MPALKRPAAASLTTNNRPAVRARSGAVAPSPDLESAPLAALAAPGPGSAALAPAGTAGAEAAAAAASATVGASAPALSPPAALAAHSGQDLDPEAAKTATAPPLNHKEVAAAVVEDGGAAAAAAGPAGWKETFDCILAQRRTIVAECDTHGGALYVKEKNTAETRFYTLVNSICAPQNKDKQTFEAVTEILKLAKSPAEVAALSDKSLLSCCAKLRFGARKAKAVKEASKMVNEQHAGDLPKTMKELQTLPGVGTKSAAFLMMCCWGRNDAAKVDVHIHRICNRLGWVATTAEEKTRREVEEWLPRSLWGMGGLKEFVAFGQSICTAKSPNCKDCAVKGRCPSAKLA